MNQQKPAGRASDDASRTAQDIPDFLVEAAEAKPQHISGARDAGAAQDQRQRVDEKDAATSRPAGTGAAAQDAGAAGERPTDATDDDLLGLDGLEGYGAQPQPQDAPRRRPMDPAEYEAAQAAREQGWEDGAWPEGGAGMQRELYTRPRAPHKTQPAINDDAADGTYSPEGYAHDSNIAIGGGVLSGGHSYRRARKSRSSIQQGRYGQYLEVPKGRRSIFASRDRMRRRRSLFSIIAVILVFVVIAIVIAQMISHLG
ncbi:hypothetical protein HF885_05310 [Olsenella umbonata]|uniref:Uncharacterized protein n=1 Tax=Parafannyhessea umbonata TaxID=604330 RepID=A0A7X9XZY2_9ACTN|nr:hypothetical protein [Parafannyhessea umbonata]NMF25856.1 hypothetical protein [Parafannyhessea umbonata]